MPAITDPAAPNPEAPTTIDAPSPAIPDPATPLEGNAPTEPDANTPPATPSAPQEKNAWPGIERFVEDIRQDHAPAAASPTPPVTGDGPESRWTIPDHLDLPHLKGGYMAPRLISRAMDDLAVLTQGKRAGTPAEAREAFGQALLAENIAPRGYTAEDAVKWWQAGGATALGQSPALAAVPSNSDSKFFKISAIRHLVPGSDNSVSINLLRPSVTNSGDTLTSSGQINSGIAAANSSPSAKQSTLTSGEIAQQRQMESWLNSLPNKSTSSQLELGALSTQYETGGRGPGTISTGKNDKGGPSYGSYQLASRTGTLRNFLSSSDFAPWSADFAKLTPCTIDFDNQWRATAKRDRDAFQNAQHRFIQRTHYQPAVKAVRVATKLDLDSRSNAVRNAAWSVSVQHGNARTILSRAVNDTDLAVARTDPDYDRALIDNIYDRRTAYVTGIRDKDIVAATKLAKSPNPNDKKKRASLLEEAKGLTNAINKRYPSEQSDAQQMLIDEKKSRP